MTRGRGQGQSVGVGLRCGEGVDDENHSIPVAPSSHPPKQRHPLFLLAPPPPISPSLVQPTAHLVLSEAVSRAANQLVAAAKVRGRVKGRGG